MIYIHVFSKDFYAFRERNISSSKLVIYLINFWSVRARSIILTGHCENMTSPTLRDRLYLPLIPMLNTRCEWQAQRVAERHGNGTLKMNSKPDAFIPVNGSGCSDLHITETLEVVVKDQFDYNYYSPFTFFWLKNATRVWVNYVYQKEKTQLL